MKKVKIILVIVLVILISFASILYFSGMYDYAKGVQEDSIRFQNYKRTNIIFKNFIYETNHAN